MGFVFFVFVVDLQVRRRNSRWVFPGKAGSASGLQRGRDGGIPGAASGLFPLFLDRRESPNPGVFLGFFFLYGCEVFPAIQELVLGFFFFLGKGSSGILHCPWSRGKGFRKTRKIGMEAAFPAEFREGKPWKNFPFPAFFFFCFFFSLAEAMSKTLQTFQGTGTG